MTVWLIIAILAVLALAPAWFQLLGRLSRRRYEDDA